MLRGQTKKLFYTSTYACYHDDDDNDDEDKKDGGSLASRQLGR